MANKAKPINIHKLNGTFRKDRHGNPGETLEDADIPDLPEAPIWLTGVARAEWDRLVGIMAKSKVFRATDLGVLAGYCQQFSIIATAPDPSEVKAAVWSSLRMYALELGLTPVARSKLGTGNGGNKSENPFDAL